MLALTRDAPWIEATGTLEAMEARVEEILRELLDVEEPRGQSWHTFLRSHTVWAGDFLQAYDVWFRPIFAFFIVDIDAKRVVQVTRQASPDSPADGTTAADPAGVVAEPVLGGLHDHYRATAQMGLVARTTREPSTHAHAYARVDPF